VLLKEIKNKYSHIPVMIMSGHANVSTTFEVTKSGADDFIEKPFSSTQLLSKINKHLKIGDTDNLTSAQGKDLSQYSIMTDTPQQTIAKNGVLTGKGLHSGISTGIILSPLPENTGIIFEDITSGTQIPATVYNVNSTAFSTNLQHLDKSISCVEHLLASFLIFGIDNILVKVNTEIPIGDGSAKPFCDLIQSCGIKELSHNRSVIKIDKVYKIVDPISEDVWIQVEPSDTFSVQYTFILPDGKEQTVEYTNKNEMNEFINSIAPARTFGFLNELTQLQANGLGQGGDMDNFLLMDENKAINTELRFTDEPARHKILDILGDLYLLGAPFLGKVTARKTGHRHNIMLDKKILSL
jgi:UDP-3-O-acyl N-acetylglucosamine deacetylase